MRSFGVATVHTLQTIEINHCKQKNKEEITPH